jgi:uncharacterized protein YigE (DUF2233 family)
VRDGHLLESGALGETLALDRHNVVRWIHTAGVAGGRVNWRGTEFAVSCGPRLLRAGSLCLNPEAEGFSDPGLFRLTRRCGIGVTRRGQLLLVTVNRPVSLEHFAQMMKELGAYNALNLDGGTSAGLYALGRYRSQPGRDLTNILLVTARDS